MRNLVILRGCPGSGKSTWIKENGLEQYTLSPDIIRTMITAPVLTENSNDVSISQENDTYVWSLLFELLEMRMKNGDFTIIDATHSKSQDFSRYNSLCETYRYRKYVVSFTDVPIEVCKERNLMRDKYKRVPEEVIEKMYSRFATQNKTTGWKEIPRDEFWDTFNNQTFDLNKYNKIHIIGDIHGCYEPLKEYLVKQSNKIQDERSYDPENLKYYLNEDEMYLFVGDYIDRGLQNKEVLEFLYEIHKLDNVFLLEGNHEKWMYLWANELDSEIKSKEFLTRTVPQIKEIEPSKLRQIYRKLCQISYFSFRGKNYLVTHAGINTMPDYLQLISTQQFLGGVGRFTFNIDEVFTNNVKDENIIQIHGHRNCETQRDGLRSYSLEDRVEFGGNLKVAELSDDGIKIHAIKNNLFREIQPDEELPDSNIISKSDLTLENIVHRLRNNPNVRETVLENGISSFNFTSRAFQDKKWNAETVKSRGLFIDTENNKVVARGYEKFFNINEQETTKLFNLKRLFTEDSEVVAYTKYNGFLGILSYYNDSLQFHSKSSNCGEYANYFKNLFEKTFTKEQEEILTNYIKNNNVSITFEVIDIENDPHIIEEKQSRLVMLDIIHNQIEFLKEPYEEVKNLANDLSLSKDNYKQIYTKFSSYRELTEFYELHKNENNMNDIDIEGVVIESGNFMTKLKFAYYNFWKHMRNTSESIFKGRNIRTGGFISPTANFFLKFLKDIYDFEVQTLDEIQKYLEPIKLRQQDIKYATINENTITLKVLDTRILTKIKFFILRKSYTPYRKMEYIIPEELINKLKIVQEPRDIISLRNKYYLQGGK